MLDWIFLILITGIIFACWFLLFSHGQEVGEKISERFIFAWIMTSAQIIFSEIILGQLEVLTLGWIISFNLICSGLVCGVLIWKNNFRMKSLGSPFLEMGRNIPAFWSDVKGWEIWVMLTLTGVMGFWIAFAGFLFPPRGIDDVYHLPPIYQYIQDHKLSILPLELRSQFAYPQNGELLFLWPLLFLGDVRSVHMVQLVLTFWGCLVLYVLSRRLGSQARTALFVALLFPFTPVVAGQAGSAYIDIIVSVYFLAAITLATIFWQTGRPMMLYLTGITCGLLIGMKYSMIFLVLGMQPLLIYSLWAGYGRKGMGLGVAYLVLVLVGCAFWYVRNVMVFGKFFGPSVM